MDIQDINLKELIERETGEHFNRKGYIKCPFHLDKTPSLSVKFSPNANKERFKCFGCDISGDAIDFVMKYRNFDYVQAREYLGLPVEKNETETKIEKIEKYIEWERSKFRNGQKLLGIFTFVDDKNEAKYFKAKFLRQDGKKELSYYHLEDEKVINNRGCDELIYNLYKVNEGIRNDKVIIISEGEKDGNTLNSVLRNSGYVATSVKGCKDLSILEDEKIYVLGDTGEAGEKYKWHIYKELFKKSKEFKFINLPGIKKLGENKDVTDWLDAGHDKKDLLNAFNRSLDLKNKYELQQDSNGIYKYIVKEKDDEVTYKKKYITDFRVIEAVRIMYIDEEQEGIKLILQSPTGTLIEKSGPATAFDDTKSFRNFLGTLDLAFKGRIEELTDLKSWINKYFALESEEIHNGVKFKEVNGELLCITDKGSISKSGIKENVKSNNVNSIDVVDVEPITAEELRELRKYLLEFALPEKSISIVGTTINNLAVYQNQALKEKLHHLLVTAESGAGKTTILENVIAPILNYPKRDIKSIGLITAFALIKGLSDGNYPILFDEFKPSCLDRYKNAKLSECLRNLYDRATVSRGDKSLKSKDFQMLRPIILVGEESYPNQEKALIERSCIVYLSRRERTAEHTAAMKWIVEHEELMNKLGRSLIQTVLSLSVEDYKKMRESISSQINDLHNRPLNTAINICCGIEILNILLKQNAIDPIENYIGYVVSNIKEEVLEGATETKSTVENMLVLYDQMIEDNRAFNVEDVVVYKSKGIYIKTSEMINQINEFIKRVGADLIPLKVRDFRKQAKKAGYLEKISVRVRVGDENPRMDFYNAKLLQALDLDKIAPKNFYQVEQEDAKVIPF